ncbi:hypothetical protein ELUMI_v1c00840 [Williamsoniiplasma luminosum]|uniref:Lipoprotein n=1 Tax=Williamsoniiplasma luminosum TaxID=214888 RepID=A0A2K8NSI5_9MOLU|nr:hypothetical protein [Williamsoniiplasma luminosum]ATZ16812.1 hypothetical protein ELUMI_v1c00840 [Williamsoniiplasma luminosum]
MKKLLMILGSVGTMTATATTVVACGNPNSISDQQTSINGIKDLTITINDDKEAIKNQIQEAINNVIEGAILDTDYTIQGLKDSFEVGDKITVVAVEGSNLIKDSFEITIQDGQTNLEPEQSEPKLIVPNGMINFTFEETLINGYEDKDLKPVEVDENGNEINDENKKLSNIMLWPKSLINSIGLGDGFVPTEGETQRTINVQAKDKEGLAYVKLKSVQEPNLNTELSEIFAFNIQKMDIASLNKKINAYVGEKEDVLKSKINFMINTITSAVITDKEYDVELPKNGLKLGEIVKVKAKEGTDGQNGSPSIFGDFSFAIKEDDRKDLSELKDNLTINRSDSTTQIKQKIQKAIDNICHGLKFKKDYFVKGLNPLSGVVDLKTSNIEIGAHPNSDKIKGMVSLPIQSK